MCHLEQANMKSNLAGKIDHRIHMVNTHVCGPILMNLFLAVILVSIQYVY